MECRWPLYERELMMQFRVTPAIEKRHKTMGRYLHWRAVADNIPDMIIWKRSKDMGGLTTKLEDHELAAQLMAENAI